MKTNSVNIASQTGCLHCWGTGIHGYYDGKIHAFVDECCFFCGGTGIIDQQQEGELHGTPKNE